VRNLAIRLIWPLARRTPKDPPNVKRLETPFRMIATLQASGIEAESNILRVEISWDGKWSDDMTELKRHLVVKRA
jgi:hypothetical protein